VAAVFLGEVGPAVADAVALGECAVEQDVVGVGIPQDPQPSGCPVGQVGQVVDDGGGMGVSRADGYAEAGGDLRERVVPAQVDEADQGPLASSVAGRRPATRSGATLKNLSV
jgi:hypothetical protein